MALKRVTVSLPADLVREARQLAVERGVSLSGFLAMLVEERVAARHDYEAARERQLELMRKGFWLGTQGKITWSRDELHER
jgi:hypothetical protein